MHRTALPLLLLPLLLAACAPSAPAPPLFIYLRSGSSPSLVVQSAPDASQPMADIPLVARAGCSFWALTPAPAGAYMAVEWQCAYGPAVQLVDTRSGQADFLLDDPTLDYRLLAWAPDGQSVYLKAGTLSNPQVLRVQAASRQVLALPYSPNTYNLAVSPDGGTVLYAVTNGIGLGSELWSAPAGGGGGRRLLADAAHILGLMRYSPDGSQLAYIRLPDTQASFPAGELWLAGADGQHGQRVAAADGGRGLPPVWSPDGTKIAFVGRSQPADPSSAYLSVYDVRSSRLLPSPPSLRFPLTFPPAWSPDGARLYFTLDRDGKMELWFYAISNGNSAKVINDACCGGWIVGK